MVEKYFNTLFLPVVLAAVVTGCGAANRPTLGSGTYTGKPPVITHYFAPMQGTYGDAMRIYLAAEDPESDLLRIAVQVIQTGYGTYPTGWTFLKSEYRKGFVGYLQWNTFSPYAQYLPEWTQLTIRVSVFDQAGNESNEVAFPYEFVTGAFSLPPLSPPFDRGGIPRLGYIDVKLFNPHQMGGDNIFER
jgi:hypothetical protein